jgi:hypothetical protein
MLENLMRAVTKILEGIEFVVHVLAWVNGNPSRFSARTEIVPERINVPDYLDTRE